MDTRHLPPHIAEALSILADRLNRYWRNAGNQEADANDLTMEGIRAVLEKGPWRNGGEFNVAYAFAIARNTGLSATARLAREKKREGSALFDPDLVPSRDDDASQSLAAEREYFDELGREMPIGHPIKALFYRTLRGLPPKEKENLTSCFARRRARLRREYGDIDYLELSPIAVPFDRDVASLGGDHKTVAESVCDGYVHTLAETVLRVAEEQDADLDAAFYSPFTATLPVNNWHVYWVMEWMMTRDKDRDPVRWRKRKNGLLRLTRLGVRELVPILGSGCRGLAKVFRQFVTVSTYAARLAPEDCADVYRDLPVVKDNPFLAHALAIPAGFSGDDGKLTPHYLGAASSEAILIGHVSFTDKPIRGCRVNFDPLQPLGRFRDSSRAIAARPAQYLTEMLDYSEKSLRDDCCMRHAGTTRMILCATHVCLRYFHDRGVVLNRPHQKKLEHVVRLVDAPTFPAEMRDLRESILDLARPWLKQPVRNQVSRRRPPRRPR